MCRFIQYYSFALSTFNAAAKLLLKYTNTKVIDFFVSKKMNRCAFLILSPLLLSACSNPVPITKIKRVYISVPVELTKKEDLELKKAKNNKEVIENFLKALSALKKCNSKLEAIKDFNNDKLR